MKKKILNWRINGKRVIWFKFTYHYWNSKDSDLITVYTFEGNRKSIADYYCENNMKWDGCDTMKLVSIRPMLPKLDKRHWHTRKVFQ
tara:strand:+ start:352 stop:612 length:261 start_codon:yes stop_codon:yes gene_type:complete